MNLKITSQRPRKHDKQIVAGVNADAWFTANSFSFYNGSGGTVWIIAPETNQRPKFKVPPGWRLLRKGTKLQKGDRWLLPARLDKTGSASLKDWRIDRLEDRYPVAESHFNIRRSRA